MQFLASLSQLEAFLVGIVLGILFALSVAKQAKLHREGERSERGAQASSLFERITYAGLSLALLFFAIVVARQVTGVDRYDFMGFFFGAAFLTWVLAYLIRRSRTRRQP